MLRIGIILLLVCSGPTAWSNPYEDDEPETHAAPALDFSRDIQVIPSAAQNIIRDLVFPWTGSNAKVPNRYRTPQFEGKTLIELFAHLGELNAEETSLSRDWEAVAAAVIADMLGRSDARSRAGAVKQCALALEVKSAAKATKLFCDRLALATALMESKGKPPATPDKDLQVFYERFKPRVSGIALAREKALDGLLTKAAEGNRAAFDELSAFIGDSPAEEGKPAGGAGILEAINHLFSSSPNIAAKLAAVYVPSRGYVPAERKNSGDPLLIDATQAKSNSERAALIKEMVDRGVQLTLGAPQEGAAPYKFSKGKLNFSVIMQSPILAAGPNAKPSAASASQTGGAVAVSPSSGVTGAQRPHPKDPDMVAKFGRQYGTYLGSSDAFQQFERVQDAKSFQRLKQELEKSHPWILQTLEFRALESDFGR